MKSESPQNQEPVLFQPVQSKGSVVGGIDKNNFSITPVPDPNIENKRSNKKILIIAGIIILILVLLIFSYFLIFMNKSVSTLGANGKYIQIANTPTGVQAQFMKDLFVGNTKGAYDLPSSNFRSISSIASFEKQEKYLAVSQLNAQDVKQSTSSSYTLISGSITVKSVHIFNYASRMIKQSGIWRVDNIVIQS